MKTALSICASAILHLAFTTQTLTSAEDEPPAIPRDPVFDGAEMVRTNSQAARRRFDWNIVTTAGDYDKIGRKHPVWDGKAKETFSWFVRLRCRTGDMGQLSKAFEASVKATVAAGCDDPLIRYMNARFAGGFPARATKEGAKVHVQAAEALLPSKYSEIRKFYACLRAAEALKSAFGSGTNMVADVHRFRRLALSCLEKTLNDKSTPVEEVHEACRELLQEVEANKRQLEGFYFAIEKPLFAGWPDEAGTHLIKGRFFIKYAWKARGSDWADTVTDEGWKLFHERLAIAEKELERAWAIDPSDEQIALNMMTLELGQHKGRERMELWFSRAMKLNTNNYTACIRKLYYLEPKWHGSAEEMLRFGRECLESKEWGGRVPLTLSEVHPALANYFDDEDQKKVYWRQLNVWEDGKASYEEFFTRFPDALAYRKYYARYAYRCERWKELLEQLTYIRPEDHQFFGGKEEFDRIVKMAKERIIKKPI